MREDLFAELLESVKQGGEYLRGKRAPSRAFEVEVPDVKKLRERHHLSQDKFAFLIGISPATLRNWEQGRRKPDGPARRLLQVVARDIGAVLKVVHTKRKHHLEAAH